MNLNLKIEDWLESRISSFRIKNRPFITLAYAQSWDGSITTRCGETLSFSCKESTELTHQLRSLHDGILVGIGTVLSDDPQLTVREWSGSNPQPIILDSRLRTPSDAKVCRHPDKRCWILTVNSDSNILSDCADILTIGSANKKPNEVPLIEAMGRLYERGIATLMVEGGGAVITAFIKSQLVDALVLTVAPNIVGGYKAVGDLQNSRRNELFSITPFYSGQAGQDFVVWGGLRYGGNKD